MPKYSTVTKDAVRDVAEDLMRSNDTTTTLDVKTELRNRGYWATQPEVSKFLRELADEKDYDFTTNGIYNVYSFADPASISSSSGQGSSLANKFQSLLSQGQPSQPTQGGPLSPQPTQGGPALGTTKKKFSAKNLQPLNTNVPNNRDWEVECDHGPVEYYDNQYSRDNVRCAYRLRNDCSIQSVRAHRV